MNRHERREAEKQGYATQPNAGVPILGEPIFLNVAMPSGLIRHLLRDDEAHRGPVGTVRTTGHVGPDGKPAPDITRDLYYDGEELVEAIAQRVVEIFAEREAQSHAPPVGRFLQS